MNKSMKLALYFKHLMCVHPVLACNIFFLVFLAKFIEVNSVPIFSGTTYQGRWDNWYGPSGRDSNYTYNYQKVLNSPTGVSLKAINVPVPNQGKMANLRQSSNVQCQRSKKDLPCIPSQQVCLFNILNDPPILAFAILKR